MDLRGIFFLKVSRILCQFPLDEIKLTFVIQWGVGREEVIYTVRRL